MTSTSFEEISPELLALATDDELNTYIAGLEAEIVASEKDWRLHARQQRAEDLLQNLDPTRSHELLYGGAVGGGKTDFMLWHLYHLALKYPGFSGLMLRRTYKQLARTVIKRSFQTFDRKQCKWNGVDKMWRFTNGSVIEFGYCDNENDVYNYDSAEYDCVAPDTEILMGDGSRRRIDAVRPGDLVLTLEGPRRVLRSQSMGTRPAVKVTYLGTVTIVSLRHRVLDARMRWTTPEDFYVSSASGRTGDTASSGPPPGTSLPRSWIAQLALLAQPTRSAGVETVPEARARVRGRARDASGRRGWPDRWPFRHRSDGARPHAVRGDDRARTPSPGGAAAPGPTALLLDDPPRTPTRSHGQASYSHPYTKAGRLAIEAVRPAWVGMAPAGERELWDLEVEGANHYVSYGGIVHSNCVCWDELTQWPNDENYLYLFSRIRTRTALADQGLVGHMVAGTNPGRVGGAWVKARFVDIGDPEEVVEVEDDQSDLISNRVFVPSKLDDNPSINKRQYRANLSALGAKKRAQLEDGDWDVIEGQYFDEWDRNLHVMAPFEIPEYWPRARGLDFGYSNPMAVVWGAFDPDGVCYVYRELYGTGMVPTVQARRCAELTRPGEQIDYTTADPSIWTRTGAGPPIAEQYARAGLRCRKANNARIDGWMRVREYLRVDELTGMPRIRIFNHCLNLIRTLPMLVHDHDNPEDLDTTGEDHAGDALRYLLMSRPRASRPVKVEAASLDQRHFENVKRRRHSRTMASMSHPDLGSW